jgi:hypothetical protein
MERVREIIKEMLNTRADYRATHKFRELIEELDKLTK